MAVKTYTIIAGVNGTGKSSLTGALRAEMTDLGRIIDTDRLIAEKGSMLAGGDLQENGMKLFSWIKKWSFICYNNHILRYIFYGGLATLVNLGVYYFLRVAFHMPVTAANVISVACAIVFAYYTNSRFVFESAARTRQERLGEFVKFVSARLSTMVIEVGGVWLMAEVLHIHDFIAKLVIQFVVLALNYVFSKLLVFRKKG